MFIGNLIRWGLPLSFVYCTIWQQDIWREGDEKLIAEQKRTWKRFFGLIDCGYIHVVNKLNPAQSDAKTPKGLNLVAKIESLNFSQCWNTKVINFFSKVDKVSHKQINLSGWTESLGFAK